MRFRGRDGREWAAQSDNILPRRWYHLLATWNPADGLSLYVNGELAHRDRLPRPRPGTGGGVRSDEFLIGKPNDETRVAERHLLAVDDFNFWSEYKNASAVKQLGLCHLPTRHFYASAQRSVAYCFVLFGVRACVRPCVRPETLFTRYLAEYLTHASQFGVKRSKLKVTIE